MKYADKYSLPRFGSLEQGFNNLAKKLHLKKINKGKLGKFQKLDENNNTLWSVTLL